MAADVIPIRPGVVAPERPDPPHRRPITTLPCPVCGLPARIEHEPDRTCRCGVAIHDQCYWGRVASLSEWQAYWRLLNGDEDDPDFPPTVCPACRAGA